jgi:hypothetical protein
MRHDPSIWESLTAAVFLRKDLRLIVSEYESKSQVDMSADQLEAWKDEKRKKARDLMRACEGIENWCITVAADQPRHRRARREFFEAQAANLTPPMSKDVLAKTMAHKMALDSNREPTQRSWSELKNKILPLRAASEELLDLEQQYQRYRNTGVESPAITRYRQLHTLRSRLAIMDTPLLPEQAFVIKLARLALRACKDRGTADADIVLMVLKSVFCTYQLVPDDEKPQGTNTDLTVGTYKLTLDDAKMIVDDVIEPWVKDLEDKDRTREILGKFKCVGCVRRDCTTRYTFAKLFEHIFEKHAIYVSEGEDFHKLYRPFDEIRRITFPWCTVEWPKNLPVGASHHTVSKEKRWKADDDVPYEEAALPPDTAAFVGRHAFNNAAITAIDFEGNLVFAAAKLLQTKLDVKAQLRIILEYALERYSSVHGNVTPSLNHFMTCLPKLQAANDLFTLNFNCGACKRGADIPASATHFRAENFTKLKEHFDKTHGKEKWTEGYLDLPSDTELVELLQASDEQSEKEKQATEKRNATLVKNPRKKASMKAQTILQRPEASAVFDELFPKIHA